MKSKINERNSPSSTALPLSSQERGWGEFAKMSEITNAFPDKNKPSQLPLKREEHQGIRMSLKIEKHNE